MDRDALDERRERLAVRLADTREYLGLSQQDVAEVTGLSRAAISAIETGRRRIESVELETLARAYQLPVSYFLAEQVEDDSEEVQHIARAARGLAANDRAELLRFAEFLKHRQT